VSQRADAGVAPEASPARDWWLRLALVLCAPRAVFAALRDDSRQAASNRSEPVLLVVWLAGIASVVTTSTAGHLMDDHEYDGLLVAVWTFLAGGLYGGFAYWAFGAALYGGSRAAGSTGSYRRSRHLLAYAAVPVALSLALLPVKLALYGGDVFHRGGSDGGADAVAFGVISGAFLVWSLALLAIGIRTVHRWPWSRTSAAFAGAILLPLLVVLAFSAGRAFPGSG
jgi:hypothetical protein